MISRIFVGGKGGVGKTTTSCSLASQLTKTRKSVLVISTDPAHNLRYLLSRSLIDSDAFKQKFTGHPLKVNGFDNLYCMEIETNPQICISLLSFSSVAMKNMFSLPGMSEETGSKLDDLLGDLSSSIPGIDEAMSFSELMRQVQEMEYDVVVFDTAPTGHTLRLLSFPSMLETSINKVDGLSNSFGGILSQVTSLLGGSGLPIDDLKKKLEEMKQNVHKVSERFKNAEETTFVCVCIPEFLSVYETERLVQQLSKYGISVNSVVINQVRGGSVL